MLRHYTEYIDSFNSICLKVYLSSTMIYLETRNLLFLLDAEISEHATNQLQHGLIVLYFSVAPFSASKQR